MTHDSDTAVEARWWWRCGGKIKPELGIQIRLWETSGVFPIRLMPGGIDHGRYLRCEYSNFARAAFSYEIEARIKQARANGPSPDL